MTQTESPASDRASQLSGLDVPNGTPVRIQPENPLLLVLCELLLLKRALTYIRKEGKSYREKPYVYGRL